MLYFVSFTVLTTWLVTWYPCHVTAGDDPYLAVDKPNCFSQCGDQGGYCGSYCGDGGFCCRKGYGSCLERYEQVATSNFHSCIMVKYNKKHTDEDEKEKQREPDFEKCKINILPKPEFMKNEPEADKLTKVLGELDVFPQEYGIGFDIQPLVNSSVTTKYELVLFDKNNPKFNGAFHVSGRNGFFHVNLCGTISGEVGKCTDYLSSHKAGEWIRIRARQVKTDLDLMDLEVYINDQLQKVVTNTMPVTLHNVKVIMVVVPFNPKAGRIKNAYFSSCVSKFNSKASAY